MPPHRCTVPTLHGQMVVRWCRRQPRLLLQFFDDRAEDVQLFYVLVHVRPVKMHSGQPAAMHSREGPDGMCDAPPAHPPPPSEGSVVWEQLRKYPLETTLLVLC